MKFEFVSQEKVAFPIAVLCRVLEVSMSGYYVVTDQFEIHFRREPRDPGLRGQRRGKTRVR